MRIWSQHAHSCAQDGYFVRITLYDVNWTCLTGHAQLDMSTGHVQLDMSNWTCGQPCESRVEIRSACEKKIPDTIPAGRAQFHVPSIITLTTRVHRTKPSFN